MAPSSRDRLSVDLQGLKAGLMARAQASGVSPSTWVRTTIAQALGQPGDAPGSGIARAALRPRTGRVRVSLRMSREHAAALLSAARKAGLAPGELVADLLAGAPAMVDAGTRAELIAALVASCAEMSTVSRNLGHLGSLLRQGAYRPADEYRPMVNSLGQHVRQHLDLATRALSDLRPGRPTVPARQARRNAKQGALP